MIADTFIAFGIMGLVSMLTMISRKHDVAGAIWLGVSVPKVASGDVSYFPGVIVGAAHIAIQVKIYYYKEKASTALGDHLRKEIKESVDIIVQGWKHRPPMLNRK